MANTIFTNAVVGAVFGAALTASGVYKPSVIIGQLTFENWHMMQSFLTATATSAIVIYSAEKAEYCRLAPRLPTSISAFGKYDANIIGGALLGTGMALAGACPGTVLAQVGVGLHSGFYAFDGAILAGLVWAIALEPLLKPHNPLVPRSIKPQSNNTNAPSLPTASTATNLTVYEALGQRRGNVLVMFGATIVAVITAINKLSPSSLRNPVTGLPLPITPVIGGLIIGFAQLASVLLRREVLGASTTYAQIGKMMVWLFRDAHGSVSPGAKTSIPFGAGVAGGAWMLARALPQIADVQGAVNESLSPAMAVAGGFLMVLGARLAGGCPSGHGISGIGLFSISSLWVIGTAMATGMAVRSVFMPALGL